MSLLDKLPNELIPFKDTFEKLLKNSTEIHLEFGDTSPTQSNLYGSPYIPTDFKFPISADGKPMQFFAQINFAEFEKFDTFPEKGLLVIFFGTAAYDEIETKGYFYENFDSISKETDINQITNKYETSRKISFTKTQELPHCDTPEYNNEIDCLMEKKVLGLKSIKEVGKIHDQYEKLTHNFIDSKIGGYPVFGQIDQEEFDESGEFQLLLLIGQGDISRSRPTGLETTIMIFIKKSALQKNDFTGLRTYFEQD